MKKMPFVRVIYHTSSPPHSHLISPHTRTQNALVREVILPIRLLTPLALEQRPAHRIPNGEGLTEVDMEEAMVVIMIKTADGFGQGGEGASSKTG